MLGATLSVVERSLVYGREAGAGFLQIFALCASGDYLTERSRTGVPDVKPYMRLVFLTLAAFMATGPASAQTSEPVQTRPSASTFADVPRLNLPVSLERIRETLIRLPERPAIRGMDRKPDFSVTTIEERQRLQELFRSLEYKIGPTVPGGLYNYEQQRLLFNKTNHPLEQPYAAYSGGELVTLAIEGLVQQFVAGRIAHAISGIERARAEKVARQEVSRAIAEFCAAQSDRTQIEICWNGPAER